MISSKIRPCFSNTFVKSASSLCTQNQNNHAIECRSKSLFYCNLHKNHLSNKTRHYSNKNYKEKIDISNVPNIKEFLSSSEKKHFDSSTEPEYIPYLDDVKYSDPPNGKTVYFETYGCQMNVNDAEYAWAILKEAGYKQTPNLEKADVVLLVTCSIREKAEDKIWRRISALKYHKENYHAIGYPKIGILGCMAERLKRKIVEKEKAVDIVAGPDAYRDIPRLLEQATSESTTAINVMLSADETYADIMPVRFDNHSKTAFLSIMRGCDNMCSYCIVPFTRGRERSRPVGSIVDEIRQLSDQGIKQVTLLGQNVNSYMDLSETSAPTVSTSMSAGFKTIYKPKVGGLRFADLLDKVSEVDPEMRVRFTSPHPKDFPDEVLQIVSERTNICKQIHLPAQSGSSQILEAMRRGYTAEDYLKLVDKIRATIPDVSLSTDMICGFCGETEEDHSASLKLMEAVKYNYAFLFKYSMRNKTHAYHKMNDDVEEKVKRRRLKELMDVYKVDLLGKNNNEIGKEQVILIEKESVRNKDVWIGRNDGNIKVAIPNTSIPSKIFSQENKKIQVGDYVSAKLDSYAPNSFVGTPLYHTTLKEQSTK